MNNNEYWIVRDNIVNNMGTRPTISLIIDLLGNIKDLKEEVLKENVWLKDDYDKLRVFLKELNI